MNVTVLGAGSWGTTVASLATALQPDHHLGPQPRGGGRDQRRPHQRHLPPRLDPPKRLRATADLEEAVREADVLIVGVPSKASGATLEDARQVGPPVDPGRQPDQGHRGRFAAPHDPGHRGAACPATRQPPSAAPTWPARS